MKNELINFAKRIYEKGLSPATSGNMSLLDKNNTILITSSGSAMGDLSLEDIVRVDFEGNILEGAKKPSSEVFMHIEIYKKRADIGAIIHSHSPEITAFAVSGQRINKPVLPEFALYFGEIPTAKYFMPSSKELSLEVSKYFKTKNAVLMANHGITVAGKNIKEAFYSLETIQAYCKTCLNALILGGAKTLTRAQVKEIDRLRG